MSAADSFRPSATPTAIADAARRVLGSRSTSDPFGRTAAGHGTSARHALEEANAHGLAALAAGDAATAVARLGRLAMECAEVLGPEHPDTLVVRGNLATAQLAAGQAHRSVVESAAVHRDRVRVLGPEHPSTVNAGLALGMAHLAVGDRASAASVLGAALRALEGRPRRSGLRGEPADSPLAGFCRDLLAASA